MSRRGQVLPLARSSLGFPISTRQRHTSASSVRDHDGASTNMAAPSGFSFIRRSPPAGLFCAAVFGARRLRCAVQTALPPVLGHFAAGPPFSCFLSFSLLCLRSALFTRSPVALSGDRGASFFSFVRRRPAPDLGQKRKSTRKWGGHVMKPSSNMPATIRK